MCVHVCVLLLLFETGAGAVRIGYGHGGVTAVNQISANISVHDNYLMDGGYFYEAGCGVLAQSIANVSIAHNEIAHFKYTGVSVGWTWGFTPTSVANVYVGYNLIYDIGQWTLSDMGCVYTLGKQENTMVINNVCHDVYAYNYGGWGLYTDEGSSTLRFRDNVVYRTKDAGQHQHYGLDNVFTNNIYAWVENVVWDGGVRASEASGYIFH